MVDKMIKQCAKSLIWKQVSFMILPGSIHRHTKLVLCFGLFELVEATTTTASNRRLCQNACWTRGELEQQRARFNVYVHLSSSSFAGCVLVVSLGNNNFSIYYYHQSTIKVRLKALSASLCHTFNGMLLHTAGACLRVIVR